jgi:Zn-dependent protease
MKKNFISLGKIKGIPIGLDFSWFLIFVLITWVLAVSYFPAQFKNWSLAAYWVCAAITSVIFFFSVLLHELGHSFVAIKYHIKVRSISLFIFGGISDISQEPDKASHEFWIAIAGPLVSFLLAFIFYVVAILFKSEPHIYAIFDYLALINLMLGIFNLIPGFPLDGGRVLRAIIWALTKDFKKSTNIAASVGRFFGFVFILIGVFEVFQGGLFNGIWIAFIGWFLESAASSQVQSEKLQEILSAHKVFEAVSSDYGIIRQGTTLQEVVDNHFLGIGRRSLIVKENDRIIGLLTLHKIQEVSRDKWNITDVVDAMIPASELIKADSNENLWSALRKMDKDGVNQLPVFEDGEFKGILTRDSLLTFFKNIHELGS